MGLLAGEITALGSADLGGWALHGGPPGPRGKGSCGLLSGCTVLAESEGQREGLLGKDAP